MHWTLTVASVVLLLFCSRIAAAQPQQFVSGAPGIQQLTGPQVRGVLAPEDEASLWETDLAIGRSANRCLDLDGDGVPERREHLEPVQCPAGEPLQDDELYYPFGIAVFDPGPAAPDRLDRYRLYVGDHVNHRIVVFDHAGRAVRTIGGPGDGVAPDGRVMFRPDGSESPAGQMAYPASVAVDALGRAVIADVYNGRLQVFDENGTFLFFVKLPVSTAPPAERAMPMQVAVAPGTTVQAPSTCDTLGTGRIAVTTGPRFEYDGPPVGMNQLLVYDEKFCPVGAIGQPSLAGRPDAGSLSLPNGVAFDAAGHIAVADTENGKVKVFAPLDPSLTAAPLPIVTIDEVQFPMGVLYDLHGRLVVSDVLNHRLAVFEVDTAGGTSRLLFDMQINPDGQPPYPNILAQDAAGRYFVALSNLDTIRTFEMPSLAVYNVTAAPASVQAGRTFDVEFSIVVPPGKRAVAGVEPLISFAGPVERVSGPLVVVGDAPPLALGPKEAVTYRYTFRATDASAPRATVTVGARGGTDFTTVASPKTVSVVIVCATCETAGPVVTATPERAANIYNGPVNVTVEASDLTTGLSGVSKIFARFSGAEAVTRRGIFEFGAGQGPVDPLTATLRLNEYGTSTLEVWAADGLGNIGRPSFFTVSVDFVGPRLFLDFPPPTGSDPGRRAWWNGDVHVHVTANDDFTAPNDVRFLEGGPALAFTSEGTDQTLRVAAVDNLGNVSDISTSQRTANGRLVNIDKTAPVTSISRAPGPQLAPFTLTLTATDALSGVREIRYAVNGGAPAVFQAGIPVTAGTTTVTFYAVDYAGNVEAPRTAVYSINTPPDCTAAFASPALIWPPNNRQAAIAVGGVTDRDGDRLEISVTRILQDEPTQERGGAATGVDAGGLGSSKPWIRAERGVSGDGRVYELMFEAADGKGGTCSGTIEVGVPYDQGRRKVPVKSTPRYDSTTGIRIQ